MRVRAFYSWEYSDNMAFEVVYNAAVFSRDTGTISPRGGVASGKIVQTALSVEARQRIRPVNTSNYVTVESFDHGRAYGLFFDFYTGATPTGDDSFVCSFTLVGGTTQALNLMWEKATGLLHWYSGGTTVGSGKGSSIGSAGTRVLSQNTWYRMGVWFDFAAGTATMTTVASVGEINDIWLVQDAVGSVANASSGSMLPWLGGLTDAVTAPGATHFYDNIVVADRIDRGEQIDAVVIGGLVTGEGTTQTWTPSTGSTHYVLVDEQPPNGSGVTDSDYVGHTVDGDEFFDVTENARNFTFENPMLIGQYVWIRNATGSKWVAHKFTANFQGTVVDGSAPDDPGTSYLCRWFMWRRGKNDSYILNEDLVGMELGFDHEADAADVRISTMGYEVLRQRLRAGSV